MRITESIERKLGGSPANKLASGSQSNHSLPSGIKKGQDNQTDSGSNGMNSNKGSNVPWGKVNDRRKVSSKMFQMTAKVESSKFYT